MFKFLSTKEEEREKLKKVSFIDNELRKLFKSGVVWYDYEELTEDEQYSYWQDAQSLLKNKVFSNEINHFISILTESIARDAKVSNIPYLRAGILAMNEFKKHITVIKNPHKKESFESINDAI